MCLYTQILHACGHPRYTLKVSCSKYYHNPLTTAPTCALIPTRSERLPKAYIAETIVYAFISCGQGDCTYTAESDPFLDAGVQVGVFPRAPRLGAGVWNIPPVHVGQEDYEMGGTRETDVRGFAAPVETSCFYARPERRIKGKTPTRAPVKALVRPAPGRVVKRAQRKGKEGHAGRKGRGAVKKANKGLGTMVRRGI